MRSLHKTYWDVDHKYKGEGWKSCGWNHATLEEAVEHARVAAGQSYGETPYRPVKVEVWREPDAKVVPYHFERDAIDDAFGQMVEECRDLIYKRIDEDILGITEDDMP